MVEAQCALSWTAMHRGKFVEAHHWLEQSMILVQETQDASGSAWEFYSRGYLAYAQGDLLHARHLLTQSLTLFRDQADTYGCGQALASLGTQ
jgi:hypothetical protein